LNEKLAEYCMSDVEILTHGVVAFRKIFIEITGFDIFQTSSTMPSACMQHYITNYLKPNTLAVVRELGYELHDNASALALCYLKWYASENNVNVQHRDSGGEHRYRNYRLDGYVDRGDEKHLAIEVNGCVWHGCPKCFDSQAIMPDGITAGEKLRQTKLRSLKSERRWT